MINFQYGCTSSDLTSCEVKREFLEPRRVKVEKNLKYKKLTYIKSQVTPVGHSYVVVTRLDAMIITTTLGMSSTERGEAITSPVFIIRLAQDSVVKVRL